MHHAERTPLIGTVGRWIRQFIPGIQTFLHYQRADVSGDLLPFVILKLESKV